MEGNNIQVKHWKPYIGQEVVCLQNAKNKLGEVVRDRVYKVKGVIPCKCGKCYVDVVNPQEASIQNQLLDTIDEMIALLPRMPIDEQEAYAQKIDDMINRTCKLIRGES